MSVQRHFSVRSGALYRASSAESCAKEPATSTPKIGDVIEDIGAGPFLVKETLLGASIWLAAGSQLVIISAVTLAISENWNLEAWQRGSIVSVLFLGIMLGNFASGPCSDTIGRRLPILISLFSVLVLSVASAFAFNFWVLGATRALLGMAFGFAQPAWITLCTEISPSSWRMVTHVASDTLFVTGEIYAATLVWLQDPTMERLDWRSLTVYASLPAALMGMLCFFFLNESATWLALQGQKARAKNVLRSVRWWNGKEDHSIEFELPAPQEDENPLPTLQEQVRICLGHTLMYTTFVLCFSCFVMNFVYYGSFYAFPSVLGKVDMGVSPAAALIIGALWELPGYILSIPLSLLWSRRVSTLVYLALMIMSTAAFVVGVKQRNKDGYETEFLIHAGFAGMKCFINTGFIIVYQYVSEVYPTNVRVAGSGLSLGFGRIGSMVAPFAYEAVMTVTNKHWEYFFYAITFLCALNGILVLFLPFETYGTTLKDYVEDMGETEPLVSCDCGGRKV